MGRGSLNMHPGDPILLLAQIGLIIAISRVVGWAFARLHQPQVMGEMLAGILLGPSLLGWLWPEGFTALFPAGSVSYLGTISQIGVIFFLFLVGLDLDPMLIRTRGRSAMWISLSSIGAPFMLGVGLVLYLHRWAPRGLFENTGGEHAPLRDVALFIGAAMSITAFPVLARILTERNLHRTRIGAMSITCAAVNDVVAWCILAVVVAVAQFSGVTQSLRTAALAAVYVGVMMLVVRPLLRRLEVVYDRQGKLNQNVVAMIFLLVLASAMATAQIGIHALFGAFLVGAIMPKGTQFVRHLSEKLEDYTVVFLLPVFFAYTGLNTDIKLLNSPTLWLYAGVVVLIACLGKMGGAALAARASGINWRESTAIGILMNTRGLMELIILTIGRELGVINDQLFAIMVLMAIVTTAMTAPLLHWLYPVRPFGAEARPRPAGFSILLPVALPKSGGPLVQLADMLMGAPRDNSRLYALHLRPPADHEAYRSGLDEAEVSHDESLAPLLAQARARSLPVESISFISRDVASDITAVAESRQVALVMIGFHKPVIGKTMLGGTVHKVLAHCPADVAVFVDRGFRTARRVLVPYLGSPHDRLALELASRMARNANVLVTVLHIVPPLRDEGRSLNAREAVDRVFQDPAGAAPVTFRIVEDPSPVGVVLHQAQHFDLVVVGVAEEWGLESHLFGWRAERIARDCPCSLMIVRHGAANRRPAPAGEDEKAAIAQNPAVS